MNTIQIGKEFEEKAKKVFLKENFKIIEHTSKKDWQSPYDFIVEKKYKQFYVEVRGRKNGKYVNFFSLSKNKLTNLKKLDLEVLILCINDFGYTLFNLKEINSKIVRVKMKNHHLYFIDSKKKKNKICFGGKKIGEHMSGDLKVSIYRKKIIWCKADCPYCSKLLISNSDKLLQHNYETHLKYKCKKYKKEKEIKK